MIPFLHRFRPSGELKQGRRRQRRKLLVKSEFILFQNSSLIFHVLQFFQYWLIFFLESNSTEMYSGLKDELENRCLMSRPQQTWKLAGSRRGRVPMAKKCDQKIVLNVQSCCFAYLNTLLFLVPFSSSLPSFLIKKANSGEKSKLVERRFIHPFFLSSV